LEAVKRLETGAYLPTVSQNKVRRALEEAGIEFTDGDAAGVRLRQGYG
jgi:hypothetical protein